MSRIRRVVSAAWPRLSVRFVSLGLGVLLAATLSCDRPAERPEPAPEVDAREARKSPQARPDLALGGVERVTVTTTGSGSTRMAAIDDALVLAVRQVNGQTIDVASLSVNESVMFAFDDEVVSLSSAAFSQAVATRFGGVVTDFRLISTEKLRSGGYSVEVEARVAQYEAPESASLPRVVIAPLRVSADRLVIDKRQLSADEVGGDIRRGMTDALGQTGRFSILDREMIGEIESELAFIASGDVARLDTAKLGQALGADLVWVGVLERFEYPRHSRKLSTSDRVVTSHSGGARLSHRLINLTTRQLLLSSTAEVTLPPTEPTTLGSAVNEGAIIGELIDSLVRDASNALIDKLFPVTVVAVAGDDVVLSQGGSSLQAGQRYSVYLLGNELHDPQTGRSLGRMERDAGVIEVMRVAGELSYAAFVERRLEIPEPFVAGSLEVRERVASATPAAQASAPPAVLQPAAKTAAAPAKPTKEKKSAEKPASDDDW